MQAWEIANFQPGLLHNLKQKMMIKTKDNSSTSAGTADENSTKDDGLHVSPACIKHNVICRFEECMSQLGEAHDMLAKTSLSKKEYNPISGLLSKAKVGLFKIYYDFKNDDL